MARPRKYANAAARQAAFRQRSLVVERAALEQLRTLLERVQIAARQAARHGDPLAWQVCGATAETTLQRLCDQWETLTRLPQASVADGGEKGGSCAL